jgi:hypothetical protein
MRLLTVTLLIGIIIVVSCNSSTQRTATEQKDTATVPVLPTTLHEEKKYSTGELDFLREYAGKYPADIRLMENASFTKRLKTLTGSRYQFLEETWAVETPMEVKGDIFTAEACMAHNCGSTNFIVVVDLANDKMYAGIRENDKVKLYGEDEDHPQELKDWEKNE